MQWESINVEWLPSMRKLLSKPGKGLTEAVAEVASLCPDPQTLLSLYVPPFARQDARVGASAPSSERLAAFDALNEYIGSGGPAAPLFLLGESGYGKSTLLCLLRLAFGSGYWPSGVECRLVPVTANVEAAIRSIPSPANIVLLLDGLDELPAGQANPSEQAAAIMEACRPFRRVVVTCHNRYFLRELGGGRKLLESVGEAGFYALMLLAFDDAMIEAFLNNRFPKSWLRPKASRFSREIARETIGRMRQTRSNPLFLSQIEYLMDAEAEQIDEYTAVETIALNWLLRETERLQAGGLETSVGALYAQLGRIALFCAEEGAYAMPKTALDQWSAEQGFSPLPARQPDGFTLLGQVELGRDGLGFRLAHPTFHHFFVAQGILDNSSADEIVVPAFATERIVDFVVKGRNADEEHKQKRLVLRNVKLPTFGFDRANLQGAVIEGADLRKASFKQADLSGVEFRDCRLEGADFGGAITTGAAMDKPTPGMPFRLRLDDDTLIELAWVNPGAFSIGEDTAKFEVSFPHGFWLGRYPVTQEQYQAVTKANPSAFPRIGQNAPVEQVSWHDARAFCDALTKRLPDGAASAFRFRLPRETEWEYACRAGTSTAFSFGDNADELSRFGWSSRNSENMPQPVGLKHPNPWGFHDMHGNVWEWCEDNSAEFRKSVISDLKGPEGRQDRVVRGGSWSNGPYSCRSANRNWHPPMERNSNLGFRVALVREPPRPEDAKRTLGL